MGLSTNGKPITPWVGSWAHQNSIKCPHNLGLKCRQCYDQRFGANWKNPKEQK